MHRIHSQFSAALVILLFSYLSAAILAKETEYLGIDIGPEYITASVFAINQCPEPVTRIRGSKDYQAYLADTLASEGRRKQRHDGDYIVQNGVWKPAPPDTHGLQKATRIFATALRDVKTAVAASLGHNPRIATISQPRHLNSSSFFAVAGAAAEVEPHFQAIQIIKFNNAARLGYNLTSCASFGLSAPECDIDNGIHFIINMEYHTSYLEIVMAEVGDLYFRIEAYARYMYLGEGAVDTKRPSTWLDWIPGFQRSLPMNAMLKHYNTIEEKFAEFLKDHEYAPGGQSKLDELRAVIVTGDASPFAFKSLRSAVSAALGHRKIKIVDGIEPLYVGAIGAGQRGRWQLRNPGFVDDFMSGGVPEGALSYREHDEL